MEEPSLGGLVRHLREQAFLSQEELARNAQVSRATVQNMENNRHVPRRSVLRRIAAALGVDPAMLQPTGEPAGDDAEALTSAQLRQLIAETEDEIEHLDVRHERNRSYIVSHLQRRIAEYRRQLDSL